MVGHKVIQKRRAPPLLRGLEQASHVFRSGSISRVENSTDVGSGKGRGLSSETSGSGTWLGPNISNLDLLWCWLYVG